MKPPPALARVRRAHLAWAGGALALAVAAGTVQAVASGGSDHGPRIVPAAATGPASRAADAAKHPGPGTYPPFGPGKDHKPGALCLQLDAATVKAVAAAASASPASGSAKSSTKGAKGSVAAPSGKDGGVALAVTATHLVPCPAGVVAPKPTPPNWTKHLPKRSGPPVSPRPWGTVHPSMPVTPPSAATR